MITTMNEPLTKSENSRHPDENRPWYKQWMVWMVITPPLTAVIAGIITINIAIETDDGLVVDDYYKEGLGINQSLKRDELAREQEISAQMFLEDKQVKLRAENIITDSVILHFVHPTQDQRDQVITLTKFSANAYNGEIPVKLTGNWNLLLEPEDKSWRISGRVDLSNESSSILIPNLK